MNKLMTLIPSLVILTVIAPEPSISSQPVVSLYSLNHLGPNPCNPPSRCSFAVETLNSAAAIYVYVMIARVEPAEGVLEASFGSATMSDMFMNWLSCADSEVRDSLWPHDGGGIRVSWNQGNCQQTVLGQDGVHAVAGTVYIYTYGANYFEIVPNETVSPSEFEVITCTGGVSPIVAGARLGFFGVPGYNPCLDGVPVEPTRWGHIKALFGTD